MVLGTEYQAAKRTLAAQSEYLVLLDAARNKAREAGYPGDAETIAELIAGAARPKPHEESVVAEYEQTELMREVRKRTLPEQLLLHPEAQVL
ncbi:hypothetical protein [Inquilinus sp.]|uniref:hypothetical protein n=1 Tax=Inquilinus sp. TaxID=1932117 RepID=UPI0031D44488